MAGGQTNWCVFYGTSLLVLVGCGGRYDASVSGTVSLDGNLLNSGAVTFHPVAKGPAVIGSIGADGTYELKTGDSKGLPPGDYVVTVKAISAPPTDTMTPAELDALSISPIRYGNLKTTDLRYTVEPGRNEIDIRMTSAAESVE